MSMTPLQARVRRFIADRPDGTATVEDFNQHNFAPIGYTDALAALATDGHVVASEDGKRYTIPHAYLDGVPIIGKRL